MLPISKCSNDIPSGFTTPVNDWKRYLLILWNNNIIRNSKESHPENGILDEVIKVCLLLSFFIQCITVPDLQVWDSQYNKPQVFDQSEHSELLSYFTIKQRQLKISVSESDTVEPVHNSNPQDPPFIQIPFAS